MANINSIDRIKLEKFLEMGSGYVCDFNNYSFANFVLEYTNIDIYNEKYTENGTSKANRLRSFWKKESDHLNRILLNSILEYWKTKKPLEGYKPFSLDLYNECIKIVSKLESGIQINGIEELPTSNNKDFLVLFNSIKDELKKDNHEYILDRLHTYTTVYISELCNKYGLNLSKDAPLHSKFGMYVKFLKDKELLESKMSEKILSSSIKILDEFNSVRNNQSFAHDNKIINHAEGVLIVNNIIHGILFIQAIEISISKKSKKDENDEIDYAVDWYFEQLEEIARGK